MTNYWWEEPKNSANEAVFAILKHLNTNQAWIREGHLRNMRLYGNMNVLGMSGNTYSTTASVNPPYDRLALNVIQSCADTVTEQICKNKPKPMFLTEGGDWKLQSKAKKLNKFVDGQFYATGIYRNDYGPAVFKDAVVMGSGFLKVYPQGKEIKIERKFPGMVQVDEADGMFGKPRSMYETAYLPKEYVKRLYPKFKAQIESCSSAETFFPGHRNLSDFVWVAEAFHLSTTKESEDGRHVICIENCTLVDEVYKKTRFPYAKIDWNKRLLGYMGQSLADQLTGIQIEINKILRDIQLTMHLFKPKMLIEMGSKIVKAHINNDVGGLVYWQGTKPEVFTPVAVPPEWFQHLENLYQKSFQIAGVSQLSSQGLKPSGINSGKALREFSDINSERHILAGMQWEQFHLDAATLFIDCAKDIAEEHGDYSVMAKDGDKTLKISWKEIDLEDDQYMMQLYPTSFLSKTPAGKLQDVVELSQAQFIDKKDALRLLDFPDLQGVTKYTLAPTDDIYRCVELILDEGVYPQPEPFQDLEFGMKVMQSAYLYGRNNSVPEERLELCRRWLGEADRLRKKALEALQPPMPAGPMGPEGLPAQPAAPPVNPLLPPGA